MGSDPSNLDCKSERRVLQFINKQQRYCGNQNKEVAESTPGSLSLLLPLIAANERSDIQRWIDTQKRYKRDTLWAKSTKDMKQNV